VSDHPNWETKGDLLQVVLDSLTYPFYVIDADTYQIRLANRSARQIHGSTVTTCHALTHHQAAPCHSDNHPCPLEIIKRTGKPAVVEHVHYDKEGIPRNVEVHAFPIFDETGDLKQIIEYCVDITERKRAEEEARRRMLLSEYSRDVILFVRRDDGRILEANRAALQAYGYSRDELLTRTVHDLRADATQAQVLDQMLQADSQGVLFETIHRRKDGSTFPVEVSSQGATIDGARVLISVIRDIAERKRSEQALHDTEERLRTLVEAAFEGICISEQMHIRDCNDQFARMLGYEREELLGRLVFELAAPEIREKVLDGIREGREVFIEHEMLHKDGTRRIVEAHGRTIMDKGRPIRITVTRDITQRKQLEEELRQLNQRLEQQVQTRTEQLTTTIDRMHDEVARRVLAESRLRTRSQMLEGFFQHTITPLAFLDQHFNFLRVNEAYAHAEGKDPEYFTGKNHFDLYPDPENQAIFEDVVQSKRPYRAYAKPFNYAGTPHRGVTYWNWQITPLFDEHGQVQSLVLNLEDVTEQQKALQQVQERAQQLQQLTLELSQAEDRERKRLAEILHDDLQQMLAAAKFHVGLLSSRAKHGEDVQDMARQVKELLAQAIDKSRSLSHELSPPVLGQSNLGEAFEWLAEHIRAKHGLTVHVEVCDPVEVHSEPLKAFLFKAGQEFLFNVIKHAGVKEARLRLRHQKGYVLLSVADKGPGFDPRDLGTSGFGLRSIQERIRLLGGVMKVKSRQGKGSVLLIKVLDPAAKPAMETHWAGEPSAAKTAARRKRDEREGEAGLRILLVDDHKIVREGLEAMLIEERDIQVVGQAGNGQEAVEMAHKLEPDVIVMDVAMPVMAGDEATRRIKQELPHIRIIALSMFDDPRTADRMRKAGATAYLLKTAPSEQLLAAIRGSESPFLAASSA
jgi:PAS domain S-box-containing protein